VKGERGSALTLVLDQASGSLRLTDSEDRPRLVGVTLLPDAAALLAEAESAKRRVRLLVPGDEADADTIAEIREHLPVEEAVPLADLEQLPPPTVPGEAFVGVDAVHREAAAGLGYRPLPHPAMARGDSDPAAWLFAAVLGPRELFERITVVPYDLERRADATWRLLGAIQPAEARRAEELGLRLQRLAVDVGLDDVFLVPVEREGAAGWPDHAVLWRDADRAVIALRGRMTIDQLPVHGSHGHAIALQPDPGLLGPTPPSAEDRASLIAGAWLRGGAKIVLETVDRPLVLDAKVLLPACPTSASSFQADIDRLSGAAPLDAGGTIASRHTGHPDNARGEVFGDPLDRAALACGIPSLEDDAHPGAARLHPLLHGHQLRLQVR